MSEEAEPAAIRVARAGVGDVQALAAQYRRDVPEGALVEPPLPKDALFWRATTADGEALGYAAGIRRPEGLVLGPVYVRGEHRRAGVGQRLLEEIERWAGDVGIVEVSVAADNAAGIGFLEANGYRPRRVLMARVDVEPR